MLKFSSYFVSKTYYIFRAVASSAPIWQFTGMTPCNDFYKVISSVYKNTSSECGLSISASWNVINNKTETGKCLSLNKFKFKSIHKIYFIL